MLHTLEQDYDLVLAGNSEPTLEIARQYLEEAGIPVLLEHAQASPATLGMAGPSFRARLFVPKGMQERAHLVLQELGGQSAELDRLVQSGAVPGEAQPEEPATDGVRLSREALALAFVILLAVAAWLAWFVLQP